MGRMVRRLYDHEYLQSNCTLPFDATLDVDNSTGSIVTTYLVAWACLVFTIRFFFHEGCCPIKPRFITLPFLAVSFSFGVSGVACQVIPRTDNLSHTILIKVAEGCLLIGAGCVLAISVSHLRPYQWIWQAFVTLITIIVIVAHHVWQPPLLMEAFLGFVAPLLMGVCMERAYAMPKQRLAWLTKVLAVLLICAGSAAYVVLDRTCGNYETCFRNCLLPMYFNHTALLRSAVFMATLFFGVAELYIPTELRLNGEVFKGTSELETEDAVVEAILRGEAMAREELCMGADGEL